MFQNPDMPTPRLGWDRQKNKAKQIAEQLAALGANKSRLSRFAEGGVGAGPRRGRYAGPGAAARMAAMARRAGPMLSPLRGIGGGYGVAASGRGGARPAIHVNPIIRTPDDLGYQPGNQYGNSEWGQAQQPGSDLVPMPVSGLDIAAQQDPVLAAILGGQSVGPQGPGPAPINPNQTFRPSPVGGLGLAQGQTQTFEGYGNLIPLGGGAYIDASSGQIFGMGGSGSALGMV